jgi:hypothetical protein
VNDGSLDSNVATMTVTIAPAGSVNNAPVVLPATNNPARSIRFDASGDELYRTTNLPPISSFTIMGWFRFVNDATVYSSLFRLGHATNSSGYNILRCCGNGWRQLDFWNGSSSRKASSFVINTWYHVALVVEGTGPGQAKVYVNGALALVYDGNPNVTPARLSIGNDAHLEWLDGNASAVKIYEAPLNASDIGQEMSAFQPVRTANLHAWYPLQSDDTAADDLSGNGRMLNTRGTLTTDTSGPPLDTGYTVVHDTTLSGTLRATDADNDPLQFAAAGQGQHGTVVVNANGTFTYTPTVGYIGFDSFTFTVSDGRATTTGRIDITIRR